MASGLLYTQGSRRTSSVTSATSTSEPRFKPLAAFQFFGFSIYLAYKPTNLIDCDSFCKNVGYGLRLLGKQNGLDVLVVSVLALPVVLAYLWVFLVVFGWSVYYILWSVLWGFLVGVMGGAVVFGLLVILESLEEARLNSQLSYS